MLVAGGLTVWGILHIVSREPEPAVVPLAGDSNISIPWLSPTVRQWEDTIKEMGQRYSVDPELLAIIMTLESGGHPKARSEVGAVGLMQVTPPTAGDIARKHVLQPRTDYNLEDPRTNIEFGAAYLAFLRDHFGSAEHGPDWGATVELIAAGYNGGPSAASALEEGEGLRDTQTVSYSRDAFNMWRERHAPASPTYDRWLERGGSRLIDQAKTALGQ
jgi:soluble lytic murein transglycosylase-like protein